MHTPDTCKESRWGGVGGEGGGARGGGPNTQQDEGQPVRKPYFSALCMPSHLITVNAFFNLYFISICSSKCMHCHFFKVESKAKPNQT